MRRKGNIYFVNTVNIENNVNTGNSKNNVLIYLTIPMDCSLSIESTSQINFENTRDQDVVESSRKGYV